MGPMSNYPAGFSQGITIRGVPLNVLHPGKVFWVGNATAAALQGHRGNSDGNDGSFQNPFATVAKALTACVASRGDVIMLKPGHAESGGTAAWLSFNVAGVAIVGLGTGSLRPKFTSNTAITATIAISGANMSFYNVQFEANFADITTLLDIAATADNLTFDQCWFTEAAANMNFLACITMATGVDHLTINNCKFQALDVAVTSFITGVAHNGLYIYDSEFYMTGVQSAATGLIVTTGNALNVDIRNCNMVSFVDGAIFFDFQGTANRGTISNCYLSSNDAAGAITAGFNFTGGHVFECYVAGEPDSFGLVGGGTVYNNA